MSKPAWHTEIRKIADLIPAKYNPRELTEKQAVDLNTSLDKFGLPEPIVVNLNNVIIGGHQRVKLLQLQGAVEVDVRVPDRLLTDEEEQELNLRLNKNTGQWDKDALANMDEELLLLVGFDAAELDNIFELSLGKTGKDDAPDIQETTTVKPGDIYQLGAHRLMCGDARDPEHVKALMTENGQEQKADMAFTDPPYNVNYAGKGENTSEGIENDHLDPEDFKKLIEQSFAALFNVMREGAVYYICSGWSSYPVFDAELTNQGFHRSGVIIWVKNNASYGWNDFRYKHEWIVVDFFGGAGCTLMGCERLKRRAFIMDSDPKYVDVMLRRWEAYTGLKALKINEIAQPVGA